MTSRSLALEGATHHGFEMSRQREAGRNCWENLKHLKATDEINFVIAR